MENNNPSTTGMKEEDKAVSTIKKSPSQDFISKVDRRDKLVRAFEVILLTSLMILTLFGLFSIISTAKANRARADVGLCIFSVSPTRRTPEYVKSCYDRIEKEFDIKVQRYGDGV